MKISNLWSIKGLRWLAVFGLAVLGPALAHAASYMIQLKPTDSQRVAACATGGGFDFNKNGAGSSPVSSSPVAGITLTNCQGSSFPTLASFANGLYTNVGGSPLNAVVQDVTLNTQDQGLNVVGLTGTLVRTETGDCSGGNTGTRTLTIEFFSNTTAPNPPTAATRPFSITCTGAGTFTTVNGTYHAFNVNSVPEPGSLWIVLLGLSLIVVSRRVFARAQ